jgi:hypothetical protein
MAKGKGASGSVPQIPGGMNYGPKSDGSGTWFTRPGTKGHETTRQSGDVVKHYTHENGGPAKGWWYNRATKESGKIGDW